MEAEPKTKVIDRQSEAKDPPVQVVNPHAVHDVIGRYELVHRLGHGGMASVYLGRATGRAGFEKLVAVKVIHPHLANEPEFVDMFLDEARIAARLQHPHIVQILDVGESGGAYFMVMEYVEGETLASLIRLLRKKDQYLPLSAVLQVAADAASGLAAAHELADRDGEPFNLVHRDVSPHNLLVGLDGHVKVVDFGIMKAAGKRSNTLTGQLRGKLSYMSPEQARGKEIDHRTDLFALGAVLWELCTNERLFEAPTEAETLELVTRCRIPDIADVRPDLPGGLGDILRNTLARDAGDRYDSAQQMLRDIRALQRELDVEVDPRADLSEVMAQFFTARIEYVRAAVRRRDNGGVRSAGASSSATLDTPESAANGDATAVLAHARADSGLSSKSSEAAERVGQTNTITTALAAGPARHWSLWLVLPLVGAAIGTAVVGWGNRERVDEPNPAAVTQADRKPKAVEATPMTAVQRDEPRRVVAETVKWSINTDPQGATVTIDGARQDQPTPLDVTLPKGEDSVLIELELDGYRKRVARLTPLATDNLAYKLTAMVPDTPTASERLAPRNPKKNPRTPESAASGGATSSEPDKTDDDDPDFAGLLGKPDKPDKPH